MSGNRLLHNYIDLANVLVGRHDHPQMNSIHPRPQTRRLDRLIQGRLRFSRLSPGRHSSAKKRAIGRLQPTSIPFIPQARAIAPGSAQGNRLGETGQAFHLGNRPGPPARRSSAAGPGCGAGPRPRCKRRPGDGSATRRATNGGRRGGGAGSRGRRGRREGGRGVVTGV